MGELLENGGRSIANTSSETPVTSRKIFETEITASDINRQQSIQFSLTTSLTDFMAFQSGAEWERIWVQSTLHCKHHPNKWNDSIWMKFHSYVHHNYSSNEWSPVKFDHAWSNCMRTMTATPVSCNMIFSMHFTLLMLHNNFTVASGSRRSISSSRMHTRQQSKSKSISEFNFPFQNIEISKTHSPSYPRCNWGYG